MNAPCDLSRFASIGTPSYIGVMLLLLACGNPIASEEVSARQVASPSTLAERIAACSADPRVQLQLVTTEICVGADLFFRETFAGNGRTCSSCHPAENNFTIDPSFIATLPKDDPLFIAERDANLATLERPTLMREFGLVLENVDGRSDLGSRFTLRAVPHLLSLATSVTRPNDGRPVPPNERTGWSGDGAPGSGELRDFPRGAIAQHFPKTLSRVVGSDFRPPTDSELDLILAFSRTLGRSNELDLGQIRLADAGAEHGRVLFQSPAARCNGCHRNAGANTGGGVNRNFDIGTEQDRLPQVEALGMPRDGGFGGDELSEPNFDSNGDGILDSFGDGTFNTPSLIEAPDTGPYFHTHAAATLEDAIRFYTTSAFQNSPAGTPNINLSEQEIADIGRFLRVLNAVFNADLALVRLDAASRIAGTFQNGSLLVQQKLLQLSQVEVKDAIEVLRAANQLYPHATAKLTNAYNFIRQAAGATSAEHRKRQISAAQSRITEAKGDFGSGISLMVGSGNLMF